MKLMALFAAGAVVVALAVGVGVGRRGARGPMARGSTGLDARGRSIVGTWRMDIMPADDASFQAMLTLLPGGGVVATESDRHGTALGTWASRGRRRVMLTIQRFEFGAEGAPAGRVVFRAEVVIRGGELSGRFESEVSICTPRLPLCRVLSDAGTTTAKRFQVRPVERHAEGNGHQP